MDVRGSRHLRRALTLIVIGAIASTLYALPTPAQAYTDASDAIGAGGLDYANQLGFALATLALWSALSWLALVAICALVSWLPGYIGIAGRRICLALTPKIAQRALATLLGVGLVIGGPAAAVSAADAPTASVTSQQQNYDLDWPTQPKPTTYNLDWPATNGTQTTATHTVAKDETLWSIAETHLPAGASDADIAQAWPSWWQANRDLIGENPNHITPGQQLKAPEDSAQQ
ncbi:MAG: LysM peptidoglycan-binding domain-containing protein [Corynebacteriales bacterium]|nr:LysM peptidoglycan-binding domain-containing protein [Mycobacteriales bacterium]